MEKHFYSSNIFNQIIYITPIEVKFKTISTEIGMIQFQITPTEVNGLDNLKPCLAWETQPNPSNLG